MSDPWLVERARRMRETWLAVEPTGAEIAAARAKMMRAKVARRRRRVVPAAAAFAIVLAAATAFAGVTSGVLRRVLASMHALAPAAPAAVTGAPTAGSAAPAMRAATTAMTASAPPAEPATIDPETLPIATDPVPTAAVRAVGSGSTAPTGSGMTRPTGGWGAAAEALRTGDYATADRAFGDLSASPDARTRDEARLARAQVWVAQGRTAEARRELAQLAASGATPLVRTRAADMMRSLGPGSPDRAGSGTNTP
ncbi:MAG TPA: hypothetical protein VF765_34690 [Polyangiaceae bacterium]